MRCHENVFHLKCFACVVCGALLKKGEQYVVKQGQLFCRFDYEKEVEMLQGYGELITHLDRDTNLNHIIEQISMAMSFFRPN